ncbi:MAG: glycosyltransferase [Candidatus Magasanikbacteria bacterium]|nr:glycosyltransferase [Candidatus Magasanikbacteria bacterium]
MNANYNPKVSIIIPVYNGLNYLNEAIDSALAQTYENVEVIVVNDGSNDEGKTEKIALSYGEKIKYFFKENGGVSTALNLGLKKMEGDYFSWLSHDDKYLPNKTKEQVDYIRNNSDARIVFSDTGSIDEQKKTINLDVKQQDCPQELFGAAYYFKAYIYACSLLVDKKCFELIGDFNEKNHTTQDVEFVMNILGNYSVHYLPQVLVLRRDHIASGFHTRKKLNRSETNNLFQRLLRGDYIHYFYKNLNDIQNKNIFRLYNELGYYLLTHTRSPAVVTCFRDSLKTYKSIWNSALYFMIFLNNPLRNLLLDFFLHFVNLLRKIKAFFCRGVIISNC